MSVFDHGRILVTSTPRLSQIGCQVQRFLESSGVGVEG